MVPSLEMSKKKEVQFRNWFVIRVKNSPAASRVPDPAWWSPRVPVSRACPGTNPPVGCSCPEAWAGVARSRNYHRRSGRTTCNRDNVQSIMFLHPFAPGYGYEQKVWLERKLEVDERNYIYEYNYLAKLGSVERR